MSEDRIEEIERLLDTLAQVVVLDRDDFRYLLARVEDLKAEKMRKAAYYECGGWEAHVSEDDDHIYLTWAGRPFVLDPHDLSDNNGWDRDVLEPLLIVISAALRARLKEDDE